MSDRLGAADAPGVADSPAPGRAKPLDMRRLQELGHDEDWDYRVGSPHLSHPRLFAWLLGMVRQEVRAMREAGLPLTVLDVGAGHGGFTEPLLASGCQVVATEMSRPSLDRLQRTYGLNDRFRGVFDDDGTLNALGGQRFSMVLCSSVLHHIPDYLAFVTGPALDHLVEGGRFVSLQDPMWYPTLPPLVHRADRIAYLLWRLPRGNYRRGFAALGRRLTGKLSETNPSDMVEYHMFRQGVNQKDLLAALSARFAHAEVVPYWSTQSGVFQAIGDRIGVPNTFLIRARGYRV